MSSLATTAAGTKVNRKKLEHLERLRKKKLGKVSKSKQKKLAKIAERKKVKDTRDSIVEKLLQYRLSDKCMQNLISTSKMQQKSAEITISSMSGKESKAFPKKLRCVSGRDAVNESKLKQANHYDTGSSSSEDEESQVKSGVLTNTAGDEKTRNVIEVEENSPKKMFTAREESTSNVLPKPSKKAQKADAGAQDFFKALETIKGTHIAIKRMNNIEMQRSKLPIHAEEQQIVETINENTVVIICGETGSGKTTQIPQFLYEAGYTSNGHLIGVTEPRRIAAISMSERVGLELNDASLSSYQIRFEGNRTDNTKLLFMTDGVLLKELQSDVTLSKFSVIVIDEAHERSIYRYNGRLKALVPFRLFPKIRPKVINVSSRQFPVTLHFERQTPEDYLKASFRKVCKIHERLPAGGILVFVSGQREVEQLIKWLGSKYDLVTAKSRKRRHKSTKNLVETVPRNMNLMNNDYNEDMVIDYEEFGIGDADLQTSPDDFTDELPDEGDLKNVRNHFNPLHCLPLYSLLSSEKQKMIFNPVPDGKRLCVVATNVAETSLTIPNVRYVVDSGKEKRRDFDPITGVSQFNVHWISQASADQRSGRAGRVQAGHTYRFLIFFFDNIYNEIQLRLYSSAVYEDLVKFSPPEILCTPIEQLVLHLKSMNFVKLGNFPFPTPPNVEQIKEAERCLVRLGALDRRNGDNEAQISLLGKTLVQIPIAPQFAKMLVLSNQNEVLPFMITLVSALSVREPLNSITSVNVGTAMDTQQAMAEILKQRRAWSNFGEAKNLGDLSVMLSVMGAADHEQATIVCLQRLGLKQKAYWEIQKLRRQLTILLNSSSSLKEKVPLDFKLEPPSQSQMKSISNCQNRKSLVQPFSVYFRKIIVSCLPNKIAKRVDRTVENDIEVPKGAYKCQKLREFVFLDATSTLYRIEPDYVLYQEILQIGKKKCLLNLMSVECEWISKEIMTSLDS